MKTATTININGKVYQLIEDNAANVAQTETAKPAATAPANAAQPKPANADVWAVFTSRGSNYARKYDGSGRVRTTGKKTVKLPKSAQLFDSWGDAMQALRELNTPAKATKPAPEKAEKPAKAPKAEKPAEKPAPKPEKAAPLNNANAARYARKRLEALGFVCGDAYADRAYDWLPVLNPSDTEAMREVMHKLPQEKYAYTTRKGYKRESTRAAWVWSDKRGGYFRKYC